MFKKIIRLGGTEDGGIGNYDTLEKGTAPPGHNEMRSSVIRYLLMQCSFFSCLYGLIKNEVSS